METVYADELRVGQYAYLHGDMIRLEHVTIAPEVDLVFIVGIDIVDGRVIVPSPFTLTNLVEVFSV